MDLKIVAQSKDFWRNVKPYLSEKGPKTQNITLIDTKNNIISEDQEQEVSETLNIFFKNAVNSLNIGENTDLITFEDLVDPIAKLVKKFENHHSILKIKEKVSARNFSFSSISLAQVEKEIQSLDTKKATTKNIPVKHWQDCL